MAGGGKSAVLLAVLGNGFLTVIKFLAFLMTGSGALLSEAVHSFADTSNQGLLYFGAMRSTRPADERFQYGYGADRYVYALISAMGIFVLGCGVTIYHGVNSLFNPPKLEISWIAFAVLGLSFVIEGLVLMAAIREVNRERGKTGFFAFMAASTDPTLIAVLLEDSVATLGVVVAAIGIGLAWWTGNPAFDAATSIVIGVLLGLLAIWLGWRNRLLILGPSVSAQKTERVVEFLERQPTIGAVRTVRTRVVGAKRFRLAVDVDWEGKELGVAQVEWLREQIGDEVSIDIDSLARDFGDRILEALGDEVDRIEAELATRFPQLSSIDIEAD